MLLLLFSSDQGLFIKPPGSANLSLVNANGNMSNNIALRVAVSEGGGAGKNCKSAGIRTLVPVASAH